MNNQSSQAANNPSQMLEGFRFDFNKILAQVKLIFNDPKGCWTKLTGEYASDKDFILNYFAPLAVLPAVFGFIKNAIIGTSIPVIGTVRAPLFSSLIGMVVQFGLSLLSLFIAAFVLEKLAPYFKGTPVHSKVIRLVGYSNTPGNVASILTILPVIGWLLAAAGAIFGIYVFWQGTSEMTGVPQDQKIGFVICSVITMAVLGFILFGILGLFTAGVVGTM